MQNHRGTQLHYLFFGKAQVCTYGPLDGAVKDYVPKSLLLALASLHGGDGTPPPFCRIFAQHLADFYWQLLAPSCECNGADQPHHINTRKS